MIDRAFTLIDALGEWLGRLAMALLVLLVLAMVYEVFMRYVVGQPTIWSFDVAYMLNGALFYLGAAYALRHNAHVRIDFLSSRMPEVWQARILGVVFLLLFLPVCALLAWASGSKAWVAWLRGAVEEVSPWAPLVWPFYAAIAIGLAAFTLQTIAEGVRLVRSGRLPREAAPH